MFAKNAPNGFRIDKMRYRKGYAKTLLVDFWTVKGEFPPNFGNSLLSVEITAFYGMYLYFALGGLKWFRILGRFVRFLLLLLRSGEYVFPWQVRACFLWNISAICCVQCANRIFILAKCIFWLVLLMFAKNAPNGFRNDKMPPEREGNGRD